MPLHDFIDRVIATYTPSASDRDYSDAQWPAQIVSAEWYLAQLEAKSPAKCWTLRAAQARRQRSWHSEDLT
jgi:hypothetical protein